MLSNYEYYEKQSHKDGSKHRVLERNVNKQLYDIRSTLLIILAFSTKRVEFSMNQVMYSTIFNHCRFFFFYY